MGEDNEEKDKSSCLIIGAEFSFLIDFCLSLKIVFTLTLCKEAGCLTFFLLSLKIIQDEF